MKGVQENIESAIGSKGRLRILGYLLKNKGEFSTRYAIRMATGLKHPSLESHLDLLVRLGWVEKTSYEPEKYRINTENRVVNQFELFLKKVGYL